MNVETCHCCARSGFGLMRVDSGRMHFDCWLEHHSDPTGEWPPRHVCAGAVREAVEVES